MFKKNEKFERLNNLISQLNDGADLQFRWNYDNSVTEITDMDSIINILPVINEGTIEIVDTVYYSVGQKFFNTEDSEIYILAGVDCNVVSLISLIAGNRWHFPISVQNANRISADEFDKISGNQPNVFKKI